MVKREKNDSGLNLCRAIKVRPGMNRVKDLLFFSILNKRLFVRQKKSWGIFNDYHRSFSKTQFMIIITFLERSC